MFLRSTSSDNIADNICKQRQKNNMSKKDFAEYIEMDYQNYRKMENGKYTPGLSKLIQICSILNITPNELLLENRTFDDYAQDTYNDLGRKVSDMLETMKIIESFRVNAKICQIKKNTLGEQEYLKEIIKLCAKTTERYFDIVNYLFVKNAIYLKDAIIQLKEETEKETNRTKVYNNLQLLLPQLIHTNEDYWDIADYCYHRYINDNIQKYSQTMFEELLEKELNN